MADVFGSPTRARVAERTGVSSSKAETARELVAAIFGSNQAVNEAGLSARYAGNFGGNQILATALSEPSVALATYCLAFPQIGKYVTSTPPLRGGQKRVFVVSILDSLRYVSRALQGSGVRFALDAPDKNEYNWADAPSAIASRRGADYSANTLTEIKRGLNGAATMIADIANEVSPAYPTDKERNELLEAIAQTIVVLFVADPTAKAFQAAGLNAISDDATVKAYTEAMFGQKGDLKSKASVVRSALAIKKYTGNLSTRSPLGRVAPAIAAASLNVLNGFAVLKNARILGQGGSRSAKELGEDLMGWRIKYIDYSVAVEFDDTGKPIRWQPMRHYTTSEQIIQNDSMFPTASDKAAAITRHAPGGRWWFFYDHVSKSFGLASDRAPDANVWEDVGLRPELATIYGEDTVAVMGLLI